MKPKWMGGLLPLVLLTVNAIADATPKELRIECSDLFAGWNNRLVDAYTKLDIRVECVSLPWARGAQKVASGRLDGSALRSKEFGDQFPNLIRVEPPVTVFTIMLYKRKDTPIDITNWRNHSIVALRGAVLLDQLVAGLDAYRAGTLDSALKQLSAGRVDLMLGDTLAAPRAIEDLGITNVEAIYPPLATFPMYHYLNPEHEQMVIPISREIMKMGHP